MLGQRLLLCGDPSHELVHKAWGSYQEIEGMGGMAKAIESGLPKMRIERLLPVHKLGSNTQTIIESISIVSIRKIQLISLGWIIQQFVHSKWSVSPRASC